MKEKKESSLKNLAMLSMILLILFSSISQVAASSFPILQTTAPPIAPSTQWIEVAVIVVLLIISIAAIVYMLAGLLNSPNARAWARIQVYQGILSIILALIFLGIVFFLFLNPQKALAAIGLMPSTGTFDCTSAYDIFAIATCNVAVFNNFAFGLFQAIYVTTIELSFSPGLSIKTGTNFGGTNTEATAEAKLPSLLPVAPEVQLSFAFSGLLILVILNQIQALLLSGSLLWLGFFVSLGLIARAFGFTRTFGGAMIALGIGLGIIYPLVTILTYGFINTQVSLSPESQPLTIILNLVGSLLLGFFTQSLPGGAWVLPLAAALAGLTFIPFLNFTIVNAFIVDFSRAIGEKLDFLTLLSGII